MSFKHIIFDLDGTLIDSAPSIISTIEKILSNYGMQLKETLDENIIGPPLSEIFMRLTGCKDKLLLQTLTYNFKLEYDSFSYKETKAFTGVPELLRDLIQKKILIYIATNKRLKPTLLILDHLGWTPFITGVYSLDCIEPAYPNKSIMLSQVLKNIGEENEKIVYVGDKNDDGFAAEANLIQFYKVSWGYGREEILKISSDWQTLSKPADLLQVCLQ